MSACRWHQPIWTISARRDGPECRTSCVTSRAVTVLVALVISLISPLSSQSGATQPDPSVSLAEMALRSADVDGIDRPGYAHDAANLKGLTDQVADLAQACGITADAGPSPTATAIEEQLRTVGWRQQYVNRLGLISAGEPARLQRTVISAVTEYADAVGAQTGFAYLEDEAGNCFGTGEDIPQVALVGEESELTRLVGPEPAVQTSVLTFRKGNLVAAVALTDAVGEAPDPAVVLDLGRRLLDRMETARSETGRLASQVLRLEAPAIPAGIKLYGVVPGIRLSGAMEDGYLRRDGQDVPEVGESAGTFAARQLAFNGASDVYQVRQVLGVDGSAPVYRVLLSRFPTAESAAAWFPGIQAFAQLQGISDVQPLSGTQRFGEESLVLAYRLQEGQILAEGYLISVRVGSDVVIVVVRAVQAPPLAVAEQLVTDQLASLAAGSCPQRAPVPAGLG